MIMIVALQKIKFNKIIGYKSNKTKRNREKIGEGVEKTKKFTNIYLLVVVVELGGNRNRILVIFVFHHRHHHIHGGNSSTDA